MTNHMCTETVFVTAKVDEIADTRNEKGLCAKSGEMIMKGKVIHFE